MQRLDLKACLEFYFPVISGLSSFEQSEEQEGMDDVGIDEPEAFYDDKEGDNEELEDKRSESVQFGLDHAQVRRVRVSVLLS